MTNPTSWLSSNTESIPVWLLKDAGQSMQPSSHKPHASHAAFSHVVLPLQPTHPFLWSEFAQDHSQNPSSFFNKTPLESRRDNTSWLNPDPKSFLFAAENRENLFNGFLSSIGKQFFLQCEGMELNGVIWGYSLHSTWPQLTFLVSAEQPMHKYQLNCFLDSKRYATVILLEPTLSSIQ